MTSRVTADPGVHRLQVTVIDGTSSMAEILEAGTAPRDYYIYDNRSVTVREIPNSQNEGT